MDIIKEIQNADYYISPLPRNTTVTMAYVPYQNASKLYAPEQAIRSGTMFPELNKPFCPDCTEGGDKND